MAIEKLSKLFPAKSRELNRELSQILIALNAPGIVSRVIAARDGALAQEDQLHYMVALRKAPASAWSIEDRTHYFEWLNAGPDASNAGSVPRATAHAGSFAQWFQDVGLQATDGASFNGFLRNLRKEVTSSLTPAEKTALAGVLTEMKSTAPKPAAPARSFVSDWKVGDLVPVLDQVGHGRNFQRGREAMAAGQCLVCHHFANEGGAVGPDLNGLSSRFSRIDILTSILEPSKVISEQYENTTYVTADGDEVSGRILEESADRLLLLTSPLTGGKTELKKSNVKAPEEGDPLPHA